MRYILFLLLCVNTFFVSSATQAGFGEPSYKYPQLIKERIFHNKEKKYHLLRYTQSDYDGKFILIDEDINLLAETPYAYNLYVFCININTCYFISYGRDVFARKIWQLDIASFSKDTSFLQLYSRNPTQAEKEKQIIEAFLTNKSETEIEITDLERPSIRHDTLSGVTTAPQWMTVTSPLMIIRIEFVLMFGLYWFLRYGLRETLRRDLKDSPQSTKAVFFLIVLCLGLCAIPLGIGLILTTWFATPFLYALCFTVFMALFGFTFKEKSSPPKTEAETVTIIE